LSFGEKKSPGEHKETENIETEPGKRGGDFRMR
jgi:hypothetical protein